MNNLSQKEQLLKLFADNGNILTLGQIMKTSLGAEYRARISELRNAGYEILCTVNKKNPSDNIYTLYGQKQEIDFKAPVSPVETGKSKPDYTSLKYKELRNRYMLLDDRGRIEMLREIQSKYPKNCVEYGKIEKQIEELSE